MPQSSVTPACRSSSSWRRCCDVCPSSRAGHLERRRLAEPRRFASATARARRRGCQRVGVAELGRACAGPAARSSSAPCAASTARSSDATATASSRCRSAARRRLVGGALSAASSVLATAAASAASPSARTRASSVPSSRAAARRTRSIRATASPTSAPRLAACSSARSPAITSLSVAAGSPEPPQRHPRRALRVAAVAPQSRRQRRPHARRRPLSLSHASRSHPPQPGRREVSPRTQGAVRGGDRCGSGGAAGHVARWRLLLQLVAVPLSVCHSRSCQPLTVGQLTQLRVAVGEPLPAITLYQHEHASAVVDQATCQVQQPRSCGAVCCICMHASSRAQAGSLGLTCGGRLRRDCHCIPRGRHASSPSTSCGGSGVRQSYSARFSPAAGQGSSLLRYVTITPRVTEKGQTCRRDQAGREMAAHARPLAWPADTDAATQCRPFKAAPCVRLSRTHSGRRRWWASPHRVALWRKRRRADGGRRRQPRGERVESLRNSPAMARGDSQGVPGGARDTAARGGIFSPEAAYRYADSILAARWHHVCALSGACWRVAP